MSYKEKSTDPIYRENHWAILKGMVKPTGGDWTLLAALTYLMDQQQYWLQDRERKKQPPPEESEFIFWVTEAQMTEYLGLRESAVRRCITDLTNAGIISWAMKGIPPKRYVRVHTEVVKKYMETGEKLGNYKNLLNAWPSSIYPSKGEPNMLDGQADICPDGQADICPDGQADICPDGQADNIPTLKIPTQSKPKQNEPRSNAIDKSIAGKQVTFLSSEASGDLVPYWVLGSLQETNLFVNMQYSPTHPSKELQGLSTILRKIRNRTFLTEYAWKAGWPENTEIDFSGLLPYDDGSETELSWDTVIQMVLHATQTLQEAWATGFDYPKMLPGANRRQKMNLRNFLVNDRDPNNCTSMFLTFLFSPTQAQLTGAWKETRAKLPPEIARKMDTLYRNMVLAENQPEWTFQHKQTYYSAGLELVEWYKENREAIHRSSENQFSVSNLPSFFSLVCQYVETERVTNYLRWEFLTPKSPYWKPFVNLVRYQEQVELDPSRETEAAAEAREARYQDQLRKAKLSRKIEELRQMAEESGIPVPDSEELRAMAERSLAKEAQWELEDAWDEG